MDLILGLVKDGRRPNPSAIDGDEQFLKLMTDCWKQDPHARPPFPDIVDEINAKNLTSSVSSDSSI